MRMGPGRVGVVPLIPARPREECVMKIKVTVPELNLILEILGENQDAYGVPELMEKLRKQADMWFSS